MVAWLGRSEVKAGDCFWKTPPDGCGEGRRRQESIPREGLCSLTTPRGRG